MIASRIAAHEIRKRDTDLMSDSQPLLSVDRKSPRAYDDNDSTHNRSNKKWLLSNIFSDWLEVFKWKTINDNYEELRDDEAAQSEEYQPVHLFTMFRYADRFDVVLMVVAVIFSILQTICDVAQLTVVGHLTGLFGRESYNRHCDSQYANSTISTRPTETYDQGITLTTVYPTTTITSAFNNRTILLTMLSPRTVPFHEEVMRNVYLLFIIGAVEALCIMFQCSLWDLSIKRQTRRMSTALFKSLLQRKVSFIDMKSVNSLTDKIFDNVSKVEKGIGFEFLMILTVFFNLLAALFVCFMVNWKLTFVVLCFLPIILGSSVLFTKIAAKETIKELITYSKAGKIAQEVFSSVRTVFSLNGSEFEQNRYAKELDPTRGSNIRQGAWFGIYMGWIVLVMCCIYAAGFGFGFLLQSTENQNIVNISGILIVIVNFTEAVAFFSYFGTFFQSLSEAKGAAAPLFHLIDQGNDADVNEQDLWEDDDGHPANINGDIEFSDVNFVYPSREEKPVLRNISLVARAGQTTALVGSSGCGKSTCISLLLRYYEPSSGTITINDRSLSDYTVRQLRQSIGVVNQEPILFATTVYENIRLGKLDATREEIEQAAREANAHNFIMKLPNKYDTLVGERGIQLSGGEKQRVALARVLVKGPTLLLLDEATSALDNVSERLVQDALDRACKGRTTIVIAHRLSTIRNADQIYVLSDGSVAEQGTHESLMKRGGKYQSMVKLQQMEKADDDESSTSTMEKALEDDEQAIAERSRLFSDAPSADSEKTSGQSVKRGSAFLRTLAMCKPDWITVLIGCVASLLVGVGQGATGILVAKAIEAFNYCSAFERRSHVVLSCVLFILLGAVLWCITFLQYTAFAVAGSKLTQRIRSKAFSCLLRQEIGYFDQPENTSGAISVRLSSNAKAIQEVTGIRLGAIFESLAMALFGVVFGLFVSWQLMLIIFVPICMASCACYACLQVGLKCEEKKGAAMVRANSFVIEVIHNLRTTKQLSAENEFLRRYSKLIREDNKHAVVSTILTAVIYMLMWLFKTYTQAFLFWRALVLLEKGELNAQQIVMVSGIALLAMQMFNRVGLMCERVAKSFEAAEEFFELFDRRPLIDSSSNEGQQLSEFHGEIEFDNVQFVYPSRPTSIVLNKFCLNIKPSQRVALVGPSGCGKSTTIQLLERFYDVSGGRLLVDGVDIRTLNIQWLRSQLGLVSQEPVLFDMTIAENITYGLKNVPMADIIDAAHRANIHEFIQQLPQGYETRVGLKGSFLSGGEKQRIAIARVLIRRPKVLLLDEATSALDSVNEQIVQQALEQAQNDDPSRTSLIVAHRLSTIRTCDSICVLHRGHIAESGTHDGLMQRRRIYYSMINPSDQQ